MIAKYITHVDYALYRRCGWECSYYGIRGDELHCFLATFICCEGR